MQFVLILLKKQPPKTPYNIKKTQLFFIALVV